MSRKTYECVEVRDDPGCPYGVTLSGSGDLVRLDVPPHLYGRLRLGRRYELCLKEAGRSCAGCPPTLLSGKAPPPCKAKEPSVTEIIYKVNEVSRYAAPQSPRGQITSVTLVPDDLEGPDGGALLLEFDDQDAGAFAVNRRFTVTFSPLE